MNEHELCCGTVADKAKLLAEIAERDRVIAAQQRHIDELAAQVEQLRGVGESEPVGYLHKIPNRIPVFFESKEEATIQGCDVFPVYATPDELKAHWQAEAVARAVIAIEQNRIDKELKQ